MGALDSLGLIPLMQQTAGSERLTIALIDGPVDISHPDLAGARFIDGNAGQPRQPAHDPMRGPMRDSTRDSMRDSTPGIANHPPAYLHGTFIAGMLVARRGSAAPAICPACPLLVRPIFTTYSDAGTGLPTASAEGLAEAINASIDAGASIINLSLAMARPSPQDVVALDASLDRALQRNVIVVAAAGNQGAVVSSAITRHPWVIAVAACDEHGRPTADTNLCASIGRRGLAATGVRVTSLGAHGESLTLGGTSVATAFVTGAVALLWSLHPAANAAQVRRAITHSGRRRRSSIIAPMLDAEAANRALLNESATRQVA